MSNEFSTGDDLDLKQFVAVICAGKWIICSIAAVITVLSIIVALLLPNIYRADALLVARHDNAGSIRGLASQYGGLASLAGISIPNQPTDKTALAIETMRSRKFLANFIDRHDLLVPLIASNGWDSETGVLEIDTDDYDVVNDKWIRKVRPPKKIVPTLLEAHEEFMNILEMSTNADTGFITVSIEHYSPVIAQQWLTWLVKDVNSTIMRQDVEEANRAIQYLNQQIEATPLAELRDVFYRYIEEQIKIVTLARVSPEYVLRTIDPAIVPEEKTKPKRALIVILGMLFSVLLGIIVVLVQKVVVGNR